LVSPAPSSSSPSAPARNPAPAPAASPPAQQQAPAVSPAQKRAPEQAQKLSVRKSRLFFAAVDQDGKIALKSVIRSIPATDSPLRDTLEALLKGPTAQELNLGLVSMIPLDSRLRSVTVRGDTAVVDFSESFRFNAQGIEALDAQLRQVVYAATEFPSVRKVQVLIEGVAVRYLGMEGVRLDKPLTRTSFQP
jgi:spore germination protein GerM